MHEPRSQYFCMSKPWSSDSFSFETRFTTDNRDMPSTNMFSSPCAEPRFSRPEVRAVKTWPFANVRLLQCEFPAVLQGLCCYSYSPTGPKRGLQTIMFAKLPAIITDWSSLPTFCVGLALHHTTRLEFQIGREDCESSHSNCFQTNMR